MFAGFPASLLTEIRTASLNFNPSHTNLRSNYTEEDVSRVRFLTKGFDAAVSNVLLSQRSTMWIVY